MQKNADSALHREFVTTVHLWSNLQRMMRKCGKELLLISLPPISGESFISVFQWDNKSFSAEDRLSAHVEVSVFIKIRFIMCLYLIHFQ